MFASIKMKIIIFVIISAIISAGAITVNLYIKEKERLVRENARLTQQISTLNEVIKVKNKEITFKERFSQEQSEIQTRNSNKIKEQLESQIKNLEEISKIPDSKASPVLKRTIEILRREAGIVVRPKKELETPNE